MKVNHVRACIVSNVPHELFYYYPFTTFSALLELWTILTFNQSFYCCQAQNVFFNHRTAGRQLTLRLSLVDEIREILPNVV
jgi:hypothetical protein